MVTVGTKNLDRTNKCGRAQGTKKVEFINKRPAEYCTQQKYSSGGVNVEYASIKA